MCPVVVGLGVRAIVAFVGKQSLGQFVLSAYIVFVNQVEKVSPVRSRVGAY